MTAPEPGFLWTWLPAASIHAAAVDRLGLAFAGVITIFTLPVFVLMAFFVIKYRRGTKADRSNRPSGNTWLEMSWTLIPFFAALGFFIWSAWMYLDLRHPPPGALEINVVAKQWMWTVQHPTGQREINALHVPVGRPIRLNMISADVIHSMFLPALRIKQDVLPKRYTSLWFQATKTGQFQLQCSQFCGTDHALMKGELVIMSQAAYTDWLDHQPQSTPLIARGEALFHRFGCSGCHDNANASRAPNLAGLYGKAVPLRDGRVVTADDRYIRDSILQPAREVAAGYSLAMPSFAGILDEEAMTAVIAYLKSLPPNLSQGIP